MALVAAVAAMSVVGEAVGVGVSVGAGDGVAGCADSAGVWAMPLLFVGKGVGRGTRTQVVCEGDVAIGRRCCFCWCCSGQCGCWPGVVLAMLWLLVPAVRGRRWLNGLRSR